MGDYTIIPHNVKIDNETIVKNDKGEIEVQGSYIFQYRLSNAPLCIQNVNIDIPTDANNKTIYNVKIVKSGTYRFGIIMNISGSSPINILIKFVKNGHTFKSYQIQKSETITQYCDIDTNVNDIILITISTNSLTTATVTQVGIYGDIIANTSFFKIYE